MENVRTSTRKGGALVVWSAKVDEAERKRHEGIALGKIRYDSADYIEFFERPAATRVGVPFGRRQTGVDVKKNRENSCRALKLPDKNGAPRTDDYLFETVDRAAPSGGNAGAACSGHGRRTI